MLNILKKLFPNYFEDTLMGEKYREYVNKWLIIYITTCITMLALYQFGSMAQAKYNAPMFDLKGEYETQGLTFTQDVDIISFLKEYEGWSACAYPDGDSYSIGYGSVAKSPTECITREQGEHRLRYIVNDLVRQAEHTFPSLTHNQRMMLVSFKFNVRPKHSSIVWDDAKSGELDNATQYWEQIVMKGTHLEDGLTKRRNAELLIFNQ